MPLLQRVLIIRFSAIGDVLLTTPILRLLHSQQPGVQIDFLVKHPFAPLLAAHPLVHRLHILPASPTLAELVERGRELRRQNYDAVIDLQGHVQSRLISFLARPGRIYRYRKYSFRRFLLVHFRWNLYGNVPPSVPERYFGALRPLGLEWEALPLEFFIPPEVEEQLAERWPFSAVERVIAMAPGAGRATKRWPAEHFAQAAERLSRDTGARILLLGGKADEQVCRQVAEKTPSPVVDWCGRTSLWETGAALKRVDLLMTNDTGVMHMAAAFQKPVVAFFGPTVREFGFFPYRTPHRVLEVQGLRCRPCSYHGTSACPRRHFRCLQDILPEQAVAAALDLLEQTAGK